MKFRRLAHVISACDYHIILVTKYRRKIFNPGIFAYLELKLKEIQAHYPLLYIKTVNHDQDHLHLLASIPPTQTVGSMVRLIKTNTARSLKQKFPSLKQVYWGTDSLWSASYFVSTVGLNEAIISKYIQLQGQEDSGRAQLELS